MNVTLETLAQDQTEILKGLKAIRAELQAWQESFLKGSEPDPTTPVSVILSKSQVARVFAERQGIQVVEIPLSKFFD